MKIHATIPTKMSREFFMRSRPDQVETFFEDQKSAIDYTVQRILLAGGVDQIPPVKGEEFTKFFGLSWDSYRRRYCQNIGMQMSELLGASIRQIEGENNLDIMFSTVEGAKHFLSQKMKKNGILSAPLITDEHAFSDYYSVSVSFIEDRLNRLGELTVRDLLSMSKCIAKDVEYVSRGTYMQSETEIEFQRLLTKRAVQLRKSKWFLIPNSRSPKDVSMVFTENYGITPPEVNRIIKQHQWTSSCSKMEVKAAESSLLILKLTKNLPK